MLYRQYTETKTIASSITWGTAKQTVSLRIPQSRRRLEAILIETIFLTAGVAPTLTSDGFANWASEIRLRVNDVVGSRNAIQCPSSVLLNFVKDVYRANWGKYTQMATRPTVAAKNYRMITPVYLRHPAMEEPVGNILGIPLDRLNEDAYLDIDIAPNGNCASANPSVSIPAIRAVLFYRDVDPAVKYLPTELVTNQWTLPATGKQAYEIANGGFLTGVAIDPYSTAFTTRANLWNTLDHEIQVAQGTVALRGYFPTILEECNDIQCGIQGFATGFNGQMVGIDSSGSDVLATGPALGHQFLDFLFDDSFGGAMSPASTLNCNTIPLGGDKVKITGTNFSSTGTLLMTTHKLLTRTPDDLKALIGA